MVYVIPLFTFKFSFIFLDLFEKTTSRLYSIKECLKKRGLDKTDSYPMKEMGEVFFRKFVLHKMSKNTLSVLVLLLPYCRLLHLQ